VTRAADAAAALAARVQALALSQRELETQLAAAEAARARDAAILARMRGETEPFDDGGAHSMGLPRAPGA
jgi:two-component sensor histidine kinase